MSARTIQQPGIELNEIDRSNYDKPDYSLPNAPICLATGFASKGNDCSIEWINSTATLDSTYGKPTNEYESYFYNAMYEVLNRGGACIASKLPYDNLAKDKYAYVEYIASGLDADYYLNDDIKGKFATLNDLRDTFIKLTNVLSDDIHGTFETDTVYNLAGSIYDVYEQIIGTQLVNTTVQSQLAHVKINDFRDALSTTIVKGITKYSSLAPIFFTDTNITSSIDITYSRSGYDSISVLDSYLTNTARGAAFNSIRIYDITRSQYSKFPDMYGNFVQLSS